MEGKYLKLGLASLLLPAFNSAAAEPHKPNVIVIFADDMGYGDLGCYGHPTICTPNLDRMAAEGLRMTEFYSGAAVSTPSRASLLTGRYHVRTGMYGDVYSVLFWDTPGGLPVDEVTFPQVISASGYKTACIGKWHLGKDAPHLPCNFGFDYWFGVPFANNFRPLPLIEDFRDGEYKVLEDNVDQSRLTGMYTKKIKEYISENKDTPFMIYYASHIPHVPLSPSSDFSGKSRRGPYGDVVEELDRSVGEILETLREQGIDDRTMVVFTSDNGPWLSMKHRSGSSGLLRGGKGAAWEGGFRVPAIFRYPGVIPEGTVCRNIGSVMDLFSTIINMCSCTIPDDRPIDAVDLMPMLKNPDAVVRRDFAFWCGSHLRAVRHGAWKLVCEPYCDWFVEKGLEYDNDNLKPLLFNIDQDPSENIDLSSKKPEILRSLFELRDRFIKTTDIRPSVNDTRPKPVENK